MSHMSLVVKLMDDNEIYFKIKQSTPLSKVYNAVCVRQRFPPGSFALTYNGNILDPETPCGVIPDNGVVRANDFSK